MSKLYVDEIHPKTTGGTTSIIKPASGSILQVQYTMVTATSQWTCNQDTDKEISVLAVNITPISTSSIIRIEAQVSGEWQNHGAPYNSTWFFYRDSTKLAAPSAGNRNSGIIMNTFNSYEGSDANSSPETAIYSYFDTPSTTSQITYKVGVRHGVTANFYWNLNRTVTDTDNRQYERGISFICVTEIAG